MKADILLVVFLIIWFGIGGYLIYLDLQIRKLKKRIEFRSGDQTQE